MTPDPCALHDLWPCALCSGAAKKFESSLAEPMGSDLAPGTKLAPGVIASHYPGRCADCGLNFGVGSPIRYSQRFSGFIAVACCG